MESEANQLVTAGNDLLVAEAAGHRQGQLIVLGLFHQVQHPLQQLAGFPRLMVQALGQQDGEAAGINVQHAANHRSIDPLGTGGDQVVAFLGQGAGHQFDQVNSHHGQMATAQDCNAPLAPVLEHGQLLGQGIDPIDRWKIKGSSHRQPAACSVKLAALPSDRGQLQPGEQGAEIAMLFH